MLILEPPGDRFDPDTCVMLIELAHRTAGALDIARRYAQHRAVAEALQHAQLTDLPATGTARLAARYLPATRGMNIGGDWYDAFVQPDGSLLTVIGDVTGHGLRAAVVMGQLRTALRAYAVEGDSPARILSRLHHLLRHQRADLYATAAVARLTPGDPTLTWAAAGHPPPSPAHRTARCTSWTAGPASCSASRSPPTTRTTPSTCRPARRCCCTPTGWSSAAPRGSTPA